jgi:hypothetical protein
VSYPRATHPILPCKSVKYQTSFLIALSHPMAGEKKVKSFKPPQILGILKLYQHCFFKEMSHLVLQKVLYIAV